MAFFIQDPAGLCGGLLHNSILSEASKASEGGGAFAFATKEGIELLLESQEFRGLLSRGVFTLVVGIDAITNTKSIETLQIYKDKYENLDVKVFYHKESGVIFHPKFSWFRNTQNTDQGSIIVGSGNLTPRGLRNNWEAYFETPLLSAQFTQTYDTWTHWVSTHTQFLCELDDPDVLNKAQENTKEFNRNFTNKVVNINNQPKTTKPKPRVQDGSTTYNNNRYLLLEVPVGRRVNTPSAYTQANLGKQLFEDFFNIDITITPDLFYFQHVDENGDTDQLEATTPIIKTVSSNYNFKLSATDDKGSPQPVTPPLCIFTEIGVRTYRYRFMLPGDQYYNELRTYLLSQPSIGRGGHKFIGNQADLYTVIPNAPFLASLLAEDN
ncbi:phospholipase D family protein [Vibrio cholerae]|nr:phospholipase D family protein [Vibrio cholerae]